MERKELEELIYRILTTEDEEIDCGQVSQLIARYVDMEVSGADAPGLLPEVYQHLRQCGACAELHETLYELARLEQQDALPEADELLNEIATEGAAPSVEQRVGASKRVPAPSRPQSEIDRRTLPEDTPARVGEDKRGEEGGLLQPARWLFRSGWVVAAAALFLAAIFGFWGWQQSTALADLRANAAIIVNAEQVVRMQGTDQDPDARGYLFVDERNQEGLLVIEDLNQLPSDQVYQMWAWLDDDNVESAGTFTVGADQRDIVRLSKMPAQFTSLTITLEQEGGSDQPTSSPVCVWGKQSS